MSDNYDKLFALWQNNFRSMPNKEEKARELGIPVENGKLPMSKLVKYHGISHPKFGNNKHCKITGF